ncbi:helix-turn-helix transcriptional regulator [Streptococcus hongkongensis]|nr:transcriptional regulator [Streptococcus uberis]
MELGKQVASRRKQLGLTQEQVADKIFVSRQSISNWETNKTYPDIQSLLLLSQLFHVSLEELIQGDLAEMKNEVSKTEIGHYKKDSLIFTILLIGLPMITYPLVYFFDWYGIAILAILSIVAMIYADRVEKFKKANHLRTYKELVAFDQGIPLSQIEKAEENAKYPYQTPVIVLGFALFSGVMVIITVVIINWLF